MIDGFLRSQSLDLSLGEKSLAGRAVRAVVRRILAPASKLLSVVKTRSLGEELLAG
ncbi:hypothetical protein A2U01_0088532, partial [Trifolium medium]|nr:hypothetical protein [Trifolium medium]